MQHEGTSQNGSVRQRESPNNGHFPRGALKLKIAHGQWYCGTSAFGWDVAGGWGEPCAETHCFEPLILQHLAGALEIGAEPKTKSQESYMHMNKQANP